MVAAFVALALCIPLIGLVFFARFMLLMGRFGGGKDDKGGKGRTPPRRTTTSLGRNPYHLP